MSNEQLSMYWGPHHLWGQGAREQGGSKLKLARLPLSSLPSLQLAPCSLQSPSSLPALSSLPAYSQLSPASQLTLACSQLSPASQLAPLAPACSQLAPSSLQPPACSTLLPALSSLPACSSLLPALSSLPACSSSLPALSSLPACSQMPMNSLVCIGVPTTSGGKGVGGKVGASWSWLASLPAHSPHSSSLPALSSLPACSSLLPAHSSLLPNANEQLSMYWGPHHLWGPGGRGQGGSKLKLACLPSSSLPSLQLTPSSLQSPSSLQLTPACSQLAPAHSSLLPACSQWPMYVWGSPPPLGCKGLGGKVGVSRSELGSELEQTGVSWSEPSEPNVILGFRIPTTFGGKTLIITYSAYVSPPPASKVPTQCPLM